MSSATPDHGAAIQALIMQGVTSADVAALTGRPADEIEKLLAMVEPIRGKQARSRVYNLWDAMRAVGSVEGDHTQMEEALKRMKPTQLPAPLTKEFWSAMRERQKYMEDHNRLWRTDRVKLLISQVYKSLRTAMTLLEDNVDQQTALTPQQRVIVRAIKTGKAPLVLLPALVLHERDGGRHSAAAEAILRGEADLGW